MTIEACYSAAVGAAPLLTVPFRGQEMPFNRDLGLSVHELGRRYRRCCIVIGTLTTMYRNSLPSISLIQWGTPAGTTAKSPFLILLCHFEK
jgi:hypothetical protein